MTNMIMSEDFV